MQGWGWVLAWWLAFAATHMLLSARNVRASLVARLGDQGFLGIYSLVALATFVPLIIAYFSNKHSGPLLWSLHDVPGAWSAQLVLAGLAWTVVVAAVVQPSPVSMDPRIRAEPHGLTRITRHPLFLGLALWGLSHLLLNGTTSDVVFFGGFVVYSVIGALHQDSRKRAEPRLAGFYKTTSVVPFAAIAAGKTRLAGDELPWMGLAVGLVVAVVLYWLHPWLFY